MPVTGFILQVYKNLFAIQAGHIIVKNDETGKFMVVYSR